MFRRSIKWRFILPFLALILLMGIGLIIFFTDRYTKSYYEDTRTTLIAEANLLAGEISLLPQQEFTNSMLQGLAERFARELNTRVTIILPDGKVAAESESDPLLLENHLYRPEVQQALKTGNGFNIRYSTTRKTQMIYVAVLQTREGTAQTIVRLSRPLEVVQTRVSHIRSVIIIGSLGTMLLTFLFSLLAAQRSLRALTELTEAANRISAGDFTNLTLTDSDNEVAGLTKAFTRMSWQIRTQLEALTVEKIKLEKIVDRLMDGIIIVNRSGQVEIMNRAAAAFFKLKKNDYKHNDFIEIIQNYQLVELWQKTLESQMDQIREIDLRQDQKHLLGLTTFLGTPREGTVLILLQDRTQIKKVEELRQTFVSNVSHELRTPLTTLKALQETLQDCIDSDPDAAKRFLGHMDIEIDKLTQMVLELLDLSRIESGRAEMRKTITDVKQLLQLPVERMKPQADRAGLSLIINCPPDLPMVNVDAEQIERVLMNLIHNSIKHTAPGGEIIVSAAITENQMMIKVSDNGEGISQQDLPRIFERFYKTDQARASGGTGLGLAIAKHIIEAHAGKIDADSRPGEGATFTITLPLA